MSDMIYVRTSIFSPKFLTEEHFYRQQYRSVDNVESDRTRKQNTKRSPFCLLLLNRNEPNTYSFIFGHVV